MSILLLHLFLFLVVRHIELFPIGMPQFCFMKSISILFGWDCWSENWLGMSDQLPINHQSQVYELMNTNRWDVTSLFEEIIHRRKIHKKNTTDNSYFPIKCCSPGVENSNASIAEMFEFAKTGYWKPKIYHIQRGIAIRKLEDQATKPFLEPLLESHDLSLLQSWILYQSSHLNTQRI